MAKFNRGDVSEGILAAAMTARFLSKTKRIQFNDVINVVKKLKPPVKETSGLTSLTEFDSPNANPKILDTVICKVNLAEVNIRALLDTSIYSQRDVVELVNASIAYSNSVNVMEWADMMYNNNQKNVIEIKSEGLLDQTGTKVDLYLIIDGKQAGVGISLKAQDVKQFGQVGGSSFASMKSLFEPLGVKFSNNIETKYNKLLSEEKNVAGALIVAYKEANKQISSLPQETLKKNIANFMKYHATRNEPDVALVQLNKSESTIYKFENIKNKLTGVKLGTVYTEGSTNVISGAKIPKIQIIETTSNKKNALLELRVKLEGNRVNSKGQKIGLTVRNYVEKGKMATTLLAEKFK
jgi:hypothetical protein